LTDPPTHIYVKHNGGEKTEDFTGTFYLYLLDIYITHTECSKTENVERFGRIYYTSKGHSDTPVIICNTGDC